MAKMPKTFEKELPGAECPACGMANLLAKFSTECKKDSVTITLEELICEICEWSGDENELGDSE